MIFDKHYHIVYQYDNLRREPAGSIPHLSRAADTADTGRRHSTRAAPDRARGDRCWFAAACRIHDAVLPVQLEPGEYQIERGDGQRADVAETTVFESNDGEVTFGTTRVDIGIDDDAIAIRAVAGMLIVVWLILAWVGVNSMNGISSSMRAGNGFTTGNSRRVRRLGMVVLAYPALTFLGRLLLRQMVDALDLAGPPVSVDVGVADWWVWVLFGLLLVAIAELFADGVALQELDEATI